MSFNMSEAKKMKYLSKTVTFGGKSFTLFSLDGLTWSSRKQELLEIKERQERDKISFAAIKEENGETRVVAKVKGKSEDYSGDEVAEAEDGPPDTDYAIDEEAPKNSKRGRGKPALKTVAAAPNKKSNAKKAVKKKVAKVTPKKRPSSKPKVKAKAKKKRAA